MGDGPPHHVGCWRFISSEVLLDADAALDAFEEQVLANDDKERVILRLAPRGQLSLTQHARYETFLEHARDLFAAVEIWERHTELTIVPDDTDFEDLDVAGFARAALARLRAQAEGAGDEAATARNALALMMRLVGGSR